MSEPVETFKYDDAIVRKFAFATILWGLVATLVGLYLALMLVKPGLSLQRVAEVVVSVGKVRTER